MRDPDLKGMGAAWRITARGSRDQEATIESWLIQGRWHPVWSFWLVGTVHLRDVPDQTRPAHKNFAAATHEFMIVSLQSPPGVPEVHPDPDDVETIRILEPPDVTLQFVGTDDEARRLVEDAVKAIVQGGASPDRDYRDWWKRAIPRTLEHMRFGGHPE